MVTDIEGDGKAFLDKYAVDRVLGEGEFGVVKLVHEKRPDGSDGPPMACKILRKGAQFKNNTLYSAIKPKVLKIECKILRTLAGKHHNLPLRGIYESPSIIYIITDYCSGGDMFQYVSENYEESGLRTEDISRISFQLFDAVSHCAKYGIFHRDIKPENIMFKSAEKGSPLQLIDFGSGTMASDPDVMVESSPIPCEQANGDFLSLFTTFAGSAFYISPEMFQRTYTTKTDVWSAGVAIYVLVAGYPSEDLQAAFNQLQNSKNPNERISQLKALPNMPDMPDTFFEMLGQALTYKHRKRMDAKSLLDCEFIKFHKDHEVEEFNRTSSTIVAGATVRHIQNRLYGQYERSVSSLIASLLSRTNLHKLMDKIDELIESSPDDHLEAQDIGEEQLEHVANKKRLQILLVRELQSIMKELGFHEVVKLTKEQSHGKNYDDYAFHVAKLRQFYTYQDEDGSNAKSKTGPSLDDSMSRKLQESMNARKQNLDSSRHSNEDFKGISPHSVHDGKIWDTIKKQLSANQGPSTLKKVNSTGNLNQIF